MQSTLVQGTHATQNRVQPDAWVRYEAIRSPSDVIWLYDASSFACTNGSNHADNILVTWYLTLGADTCPGLFRHADRGPNILYTDGHGTAMVDLLSLEDPKSRAIE